MNIQVANTKGNRLKLANFIKIGSYLVLGLSSAASYSSVLYGQDFTSIGASSFVYESPYLDEGVVNTWSPFIALQYGNFFVRNVEAGYQVLNDYDYGAAVSFSGDELSKQRRGQVVNTESGSALSDVNEGFNIKGSFSLYHQSGIYTLTAMQDVSGVHDGVESTLSWLYTLRGRKVNWYPSIYATWMNDKLVGHYFTPQETSGWRYGVGMTIDCHPSVNWLVQTLVANESYSKNITDSPVIDRSNTWLVSFNLGYYL